jgi:cell division protease FtsH
MDTKWLRNSFVYLLIIVALIALFLSFFPSGGGRQPQQESLGDVMQEARQGQIKQIVVQGNTWTVQHNDGVEAHVEADPNTNVYQVMEAAGVPQSAIAKIDVVYQKPAELGNWLGLMLQFLPFVFLAGVFLFMMRQA